MTNKTHIHAQIKKYINLKKKKKGVCALNLSEI